MDLLCRPGDPTVIWDGRRFSPCFADLYPLIPISIILPLRCAVAPHAVRALGLLFLIKFPCCRRRTVLGLGGNLVATVAVVALFVAKRNAPGRTENARRSLPEKLLVFGIPSFAACFSLLGLIVLVKKKFEGIDVPNHELLFRSSQFLAWVSVSLVSAIGPWFEILYNPFICICWMLKILLEIPRLQYSLTAMKAMSYFTEIVSFSTSITFGLFLIVATAAGRLCNKREMNSIEAPLIPNNVNCEAESTNLVYKHQSIWELLTFKSVNPMMDIGITRQLDFVDILELPSELRAASCYDKLLSSWTAEHQNHHADSSLLRSMFHAYGWIYLRLAMLKVINDSISFVSPLLLNKFIRLIQQGSVGMDGYTIAISLGLTSIIKSFLDTQYSFRLAKLKLMLRSSIMGIVYRKSL